MNKKTVSQSVKDFCKTFAIIYGVGICFNITAHVFAYVGSVLNLGDWFDKLVNWLMFPYVLVFGMLSFLMGCHIFGNRDPHAADTAALLGYDKLKRKSSEFVPLPQLRTEAGRKTLKKLLAAYEADRPDDDMDYRKNILSSGGWLCACGRTNPKYTFTCVCGKKKRSAISQELVFEKPSDVPEQWHCICGNTNLFYSSRCTCGRKKQDVPMSHRYPISKGETWHCPCGRTNPCYTSTCVCGKNKRDI